MSGDCSTDLFTSTRPLYSLQPLVADKDNFTSVAVGFAVLNLVLGVYTILASCFVVRFYWDKANNHVVPMLYFFIASNDILTGFTAILHSVLLILLLSLPCPTSPHVYNLSYLASFLTMWTLRISVFYNLLLFITRTINIVSPFYPVSKRLLLAFLITTPWLPWFPVIIHQLTVKYEGADYMAFKMRILSSSSLVGEDLIHSIFGTSHYPPLIICLVIPFLLPTVIAVVSLVIQLKCLLSGSSPDGTVERDPVKVRAAVTILLLTLVFSLCSTSSVTYWMRVCLDIQDDYINDKNVVWVYVTGVTVPFLNSVIAPTVLIYRGNKLREMVRHVLFGVRVSSTESKSAAVATEVTNYNQTTLQMPDLSTVVKSDINVQGE